MQVEFEPRDGLIGEQGIVVVVVSRNSNKAGGSGGILPQDF